MLLINVALYGGHDVDALLVQACCSVESAVLTGALACFAGFFEDSARQPDPPGLPTVRAFQRAQARAVLRWVRHRIDRAG